MRIFYDDIGALHQLTMNLDCYPEMFFCPGCSKNNQFVAHGFIRHQFKDRPSEISGKRIFCCNRRGRSGCGRTISLYLKTRQPKFVYSTAHINVFFCYLLMGSSIPQAYQIATQCYEPRNAYRWMNKAYNRLIEYRMLLKMQSIETLQALKVKSLSFKILLSTLNSLFSQLALRPCQAFQLKTQQAFL